MQIYLLYYFFWNKTIQIRELFSIYESWKLLVLYSGGEINILSLGSSMNWYYTFLILFVFLRFIISVMLLHFSFSSFLTLLIVTTSLSKWRCNGNTFLTSESNISSCCYRNLKNVISTLSHNDCYLTPTLQFFALIPYRIIGCCVFISTFWMKKNRWTSPCPYHFEEKRNCCDFYLRVFMRFSFDPAEKIIHVSDFFVLWSKIKEE